MIHTGTMRSLRLLLLLPLTLLGQAPLAAPPSDHPDLYYAFFTKGPQSLGGLGFSAGEAVKVSSVSTSAAADLAAIDQHRQAYLAQATRKGEQPKASTLQAFDAARALTSLRGAGQLRQNVSPQSWHTFQTWINGPFKASLGGH